MCGVDDEEREKRNEHQSMVCEAVMKADRAKFMRGML